jgi:hypothetical protein
MDTTESLLADRAPERRADVLRNTECNVVFASIAMAQWLIERVDKPPKQSDKDQSPIKPKQKRTSRGGAPEKLAAALRSLTSRGGWGKTRQQIWELADISKSQFYELIGEDGPLHNAMKRYEDDSRKNAPARDDNW